MAEKTLAEQCAERGIHVMRVPMTPGRYTYLGVFPPARTWPTEDEACLAALAHYWAIQPEED